MEYAKQHSSSSLKLKPRLIIHGGAGNAGRDNVPPDKYKAYRSALLSIVTKTNDYMTSGKGLSALDIATHAVCQLEDNPLFNASHGAVFTRDGINELEASVMVSRGHAKRGVGVMGLRRVRHPIMLAKLMLEHGDADLSPSASSSGTARTGAVEGELDVPSAQGHTQLHGEAAEQLARMYDLEMVEPSYFFTQHRWDEHVRALEREKQGKAAAATWSPDEFLPQGTVGAVAMDENGVICVATSTGGMTNKLTGRIGDTPVPGAGFWAEEWSEDGDPTGRGFWERMREAVASPGSSSLVTLAGPLKGLLADCLPSPSLYTPLPHTTTTRSMATSGTGNGDSFLRTGAGRTVGAMARWKPEPMSLAISHVAGPGGVLQSSAEDRWGRTGEGEGGMIAIESAITRDASGRVVDTRSEILMDFNCGGMFRAWINDDGEPVMSVWTNYGPDEPYCEK